MVRVFLKGGVWKNSEDEVLKAAVQKYGKQQWARVASLLNRKTAKQAKARWYEWLDPAIKKTEWSREEEEKLLHLAKLMPAQWKTIGPLVGRTATQCQEHYERLLDQAATASSSSSGSGEDDLRKQAALRPGQIDSHPETKPAKPDPIDMDEDELEMLQEARARLANTMGKKAKRKQREKMLAQAKRLADLQKRRELKAAGLLSQAALKRSRRLKRGEIDLGVEIPFYKPAPAGFHDVSNEQARTESIREKRWKQVDLHQVNENRYQTRDLEEAQRQKREERRLQILQQVNETYAKEKKQQEEAALARPARGSLKLPEPTLTDAELAELAKRQQLEISRPAVLGGGSDATMALVGDYTDRPLPTPMRTPFSAAASASTSTRRDLVQEASQLRRLERGQTPLMMGTASGEVDQDDDDEDDLNLGQGQNGKVSAAAATPLLPGDRSFRGGATPLTAAMPRDELGLNRPATAASIIPGVLDTDAASVGASTWATQTTHAIRELARQERRQAKRARLELEAALAALPAPQYEYELAAPTTTEDDDDDDEGGRKKVTTVADDQADVEAAQLEDLRKQAQKKFEARSTALKRNDLPRPPRPCVLFDEDAANRLIQEELLILLQHDARAYPIATSNDQNAKKRRKRKQDAAVLMEDVATPDKPLQVIPQDALQSARQVIDAELLELMNDKVLSVLADNKASNPEEALALLSREVINASRSGSNKMVYTEKGWIEPTCDEEIKESLKLEFEALKDATEALRKKNDKLESKLKVVNGGYAKRSEKCSEEILAAFTATQNARIEQSVYRMLQSQELQGGAERIDRLREDVKRLQAMEAELQKQYSDLLVKKRRKMVLAGAGGGQT